MIGSNLRAKCVPARLLVQQRALLAPIVAACGLSLITLGSTGPQSLRAENIEAPQRVEPPLVYRRIFVPADRVAAWPRDGEKYLPIESRDFEAWVKAANRSAVAGPLATISEAEYSARLDGDRLVEGRGQWRIDVRGDGQAFLPLHDLSLVVREPRWKNAAQQPARLGTWGRSGGQPTSVGLEVPRSGILEFSWQTQSHSLFDGIEIPLRLPAATSSRLFLDLPEGKRPRIDGGVVLESSTLQPDGASADKSRRRWELALNPSAGTTLRIADVNGAPAVEPTTLKLRDDLSYRVTQRGLDIVATWRLDDSIGQRRELVVTLPPGVQPVSAMAEGRELAWRIAKNAEASANSAVVELPEVTAPRTLRITFRAWQPLVVDRPWQLPKLRPEGVYWSSGNIELSVASQLELRALTPTDCFQTGVSLVESNASGLETCWLSAYSPAANVAVTVSRRQPQATVRLSSSLVLSDPDINGTLITKWGIARGSVHRLSGELATGWTVEAIETVPADALGEWFIDRRDGRKLIEIQLAPSATSARGVSVIVTGRLQRFRFAESISADSLRMVKWRDARIARHLLTFQTIEPFAVEPSGDLPVRGPDTIDDEDRALLDAAAGENIIFDLTHADESAGVQLKLKGGQYEADIWLDVAYFGKEIRQTYHLVCRPKLNRIDRLLVFFTAALGDKVRWIEKTSAATLAAERVPNGDPRMAGYPAGGELWAVRLSRPTTGSVEITATLTEPWPKQSRLPLFCLPEAVEQYGRVLVRGAIGAIPLLEPHRLRPIPLPADSHDHSETRVAASIPTVPPRAESGGHAQW